MPVASHSYQILIVDDDKQSLKQIANTVQSLGAVSMSISAEEALVHVQKTLPDLILLDINMPDVDGIELCRQLKAFKHLEQVPIIFITAYEQQSIQIKAFEAGALDYITKPIQKEVLVARITTHLKLISQTRKLAKANKNLSQLISKLPIFISYWNTDLINVYHNDYDNKWFEKREDQENEIALSELFKAQEFETLKSHVDKAINGQDSIFTFGFVDINGHHKIVQVSLLCEDSFGYESGFLMVMTDITQHQDSAETKLAFTHSYDKVFETLGDAVITTDINGKITHINRIAEQLTGVSNKEGTGCPVEEVVTLVDASSKDVLINPVAFALSEKSATLPSTDALLISRNRDEYFVEDCASPIFDENKKLLGAVLVFQDVSELKKAEIQLAHSTNHDTLTDLPNRNLLMDRTAQAIKEAQRDKHEVAMLIIDLDHFQYTNNQYGYETGDRIIVDVANFLRANIRQSDTLSRQGGDTFVLLTPVIGTVKDLADLADKLKTAIESKQNYAGVPVKLTCSVGIAMYPIDCDNAQSLYRCAESAMHEMKRSGRNNCRFYSREAEASLRQSFEDAERLRDGIRNDEIDVYFQPKVNGLTGTWVGCEALARWPAAKGVLAFPDKFIALAEESGLIIELGELLMRKSLMALKAWRESNLGIEKGQFRLALNISALQFKPSLIETLDRIMQETNTAPQWLELEITESILLNQEKALFTFNGLKELGIKISMDDFGTGFSSLSYIEKYPLDIIKVDKSFVLGMLDNRVSRTIVQTICILSNNLDLEMVAEGVETVEHRNALLSFGCTIFQGFLYSKALEKTEFEKQLAKNLQ
jgi:diguanylate cyclase (GGDEF)-like protein/PAS domain S-box-containing protein